MKDPETTESRDAFAQWLRRTHGPAHARRTAERNAAFLLPHLRPGMRLIDCGCGPGSITVGLAAVVAPGEVIGVDANEQNVAVARALAADRGCATTRFEVGDIYDLPIDDATFDAAFVHAVLQHLADPLAALREVRRVLKPGGVIGVADADHDGGLFAPSDPVIDHSFAVVRRMRERDGGDPCIGRRLRILLHEAGFARSIASVSTVCDGSAEALLLQGEWWARYVEAPEFVETAARLGFARSDELRAMAGAWRTWARHPGAFWARMWCQAVAWKGMSRSS